MQKVRVLFLSGVVAALAGCMAPQPEDRSAVTLKQIEARYGAIDSRENRKLIRSIGADGTGFSMFRVYSEKPFPNRFGSEVPQSFENSLVLDAGVEVRMEGGFPLYRIGLRPLKLPELRLSTWPAHVRIERGGESVLAARLPAARIPNEKGMIWTDWTYCAECFGLDRIVKAGWSEREAAFADLGLGRAAAMRRNEPGSPLAGRVRFVPVPGVGIAAGEEAERLATLAGREVSRTRARLDEIAPARVDYAAFSETFLASMSPWNKVLEVCGIYRPNSYAPEEAAAAASRERARAEAYHACGTHLLEDYAGEAGRLREEELAAFRTRERLLAARADMDDAERIAIPVLREEVTLARAALDDLFEATLPDSVPVSEPEDIRGVAEKALDRADDAAGESESEIEEAPQQDAVFLARLLPEGADMTIGENGTEGCVADLPCETGKVIPLIAARSWCAEAGGETDAVAGWGLVVQRYLPSTAQERAAVEKIPSDEARVHALAESDEEALAQGLKSLRQDMVGPDGTPVFFTSYEAFYAVNTVEKGCMDNWRDAARHKVFNNPDFDRDD